MARKIVIDCHGLADDFDLFHRVEILASDLLADERNGLRFMLL